MRTIDLSWWNERFEDGMRAFGGASIREQTEPRRDTVDMRIDRKCRMPASEQQHARDGFRAHTGEFG